MPKTGPEANTVGYVVGLFVSHHGKENPGNKIDGKSLSVVAFGSEKHYGIDIPSSEVSITEVTKVSDDV